MPRSRAKNEEIRSSRQSQILRAAQRVFAERGYHAANVAEVAAAAGVSQGTVYHYFDSKEALLMAVYEEWETANLQQEMEAALAATPTASGKLALVARAAAQRIEGSYELLKAQIEFWSHIPRHEAIRERFKMMFARMSAQIAAVVREGMDAGEFREMDAECIARWLIAGFDGLIIQWLADRASIDWQASTDTLIELMLGGLLRPGANRDSEGTS
jgi:TetR/AcrR family fatty acid metabolism transcriptional regulator